MSGADQTATWKPMNMMKSPIAPRSPLRLSDGVHDRLTETDHDQGQHDQTFEDDHPHRPGRSQTVPSTSPKATAALMPRPAARAMG